MAVGSLYRVARAGVQELLVSYKTERNVAVSSLGGLRVVYTHKSMSRPQT